MAEGGGELLKGDAEPSGRKGVPWIPAGPPQLRAGREGVGETRGSC